jgi:glycoprotein endo-alpha-1,2-mannosidase
VVRPGFALLLAAAALCVPVLSRAGTSAPAVDIGPAGPPGGREVGIFYYPWFGTPQRDGRWEHWNQEGANPPRMVASSFYPRGGPYSSTDPNVVATHMSEIAAAGVSTVIVSWWGMSSAENRRLPELVAAARSRDLRIAVHIEPYGGRTAATVGEDVAYLRGFGITDIYVYGSTWVPDRDWAKLNDGLNDVRLFANTALPGKAAAGHFDGLYTYDVLVYSGNQFRRICESARRLKLLCAPSVGPGYDARRATSDDRVRARRDGITYDAMWRRAIRARADLVTITSFNEWHEGTQIEPAQDAGSAYESYDGAWGLTGAAAETAYLDRTAYWAHRYAGLDGPR